MAEPAPLSQDALRRAIHDRVRAAHPRLGEALRADVQIFAAFREEPHRVHTRLALLRAVLALSWRTDAFLALALYRVRARLLARRVPVLPTLLHRLGMMLCQLDIGEPVVVAPGIYVPHGQVVLDGLVEIGRGAVLTPWITVGLIEGQVQGPRIGERVLVGSGARVLGPVEVGAEARIGAGAVVLCDVPPGATAVGVPARVVPARPARAEPASSTGS